MFSEILRIKPVIDGGSAARAERTLSQRFSKVTRTFARGLKMAVTGTALGIGLNLLAKILNPIKELEEKMDALLGKGKDLAESADRFGTTPGNLQRLTAAGASLGVKPEDMQKLLEKFADSVETAREELDKPVKDRSQATNIIQNFAQEEDIAESFFKFMQSLKTISDQGVRGRVEKEVLGERLFGFKRAFADNPNLKGTLDKLPDEQLLNAATGRVADMGLQVQSNEALREINDFVQKASLLNKGNAPAINTLEAKRLQKENEQFANFNAMAKAAKGIEEAMAVLQKPLVELQKGIAGIVSFTEGLRKTTWFRNVVGGK